MKKRSKQYFYKKKLAKILCRILKQEVTNVIDEEIINRLKLLSGVIVDSTAPAQG